MLSRFPRIAVLIVGLAVAVPTLAAGTAAAAPGGNGGGGSGGGSGAATLVLSPNPAPAYSSFHGTGCGYVVGKAVQVSIKNSTSNNFFAIGTDAGGCISFYGFTNAPGSYTVETYQGLKGKNLTLMARAALTVQ